jgi:hypothetical protein
MVTRSTSTLSDVAELYAPAGHPSRVGDAEASNQPAGVDRRVHARLSASECQWLGGARFKYGPDVRVVDISTGGMRIETERRLACHTRIVFELAAPESRILVPSRIVRCGRGIVEGATVYRGACVFDRPLTLPGIPDSSRDTGQRLPHVADLARTQASPLESRFQKVVARYWDGRLLRGYTSDFHASKPHLHLSPDPTSGPAVFIPLAQLKAVFFVKDFAGDSRHVEGAHFASRPPGRRIAVTFRDGEVLVGSTLNYRTDGEGFFVYPADARSNNLRVFVTHAAIRFIQFR